MSSGGLTSAIADAPPSGTYDVAAAPAALSGKAKVAAALLVAGIVGTAAIVGTTGGSKPGPPSTLGAQADFSPFVPPTINAPCGCKKVTVYSNCEEGEMQVFDKNANAFVTNDNFGNPWKLMSLSVSNFDDSNILKINCKHSGKGNVGGFAARISLCGTVFDTASGYTQFASFAEAPAWYMYADKSFVTPTSHELVFPDAITSNGDIVRKSGASSNDMYLENSAWVWDELADVPHTMEYHMKFSGLGTCSPTIAPSTSPTKAPSKAPSASPSAAPTVPTEKPTASPSPWPTWSPTAAPTVPTEKPTASPSPWPTWSPTANPTGSPTKKPTLQPTESPTANPTGSPTKKPTLQPTESPTGSPTKKPTLQPTESPTQKPTASPTQMPTASPTTKVPTQSPTQSPTQFQTNPPSTPTTSSPTTSPTKSPTPCPTTWKWVRDATGKRVIAYYDCNGVRLP